MPTQRKGEIPASCQGRDSRRSRDGRESPPECRAFPRRENCPGLEREAPVSQRRKPIASRAKASAALGREEAVATPAAHSRLERPSSQRAFLSSSERSSSTQRAKVAAVCALAENSAARGTCRRDALSASPSLERGAPAARFWRVSPVVFFDQLYSTRPSPGWKLEAPRGDRLPRQQTLRRVRPAALCRQQAMRGERPERLSSSPRAQPLALFGKREFSLEFETIILRRPRGFVRKCSFARRRGAARTWPDGREESCSDPSLNCKALAASRDSASLAEASLNLQN